VVHFNLVHSSIFHFLFFRLNFQLFELTTQKSQERIEGHLFSHLFFLISLNTISHNKPALKFVIVNNFFLLNNFKLGLAGCFFYNSKLGVEINKTA